jgi:hypothetical protein
MGLAALVAGALRPGLLRSVAVQDGLSSLKQLIDQNVGVDQNPDPFCFGLLRHFDIPELRKLVNAWQ